MIGPRFEGKGLPGCVVEMRRRKAAAAAGESWPLNLDGRVENPWFPTIGRTTVAIEREREETEFAVWVCRNACPYLVECDAQALARREEHGVWGGRYERTRLAELGIKRRGRAYVAGSNQPQLALGGS